MLRTFHSRASFRAGFGRVGAVLSRIAFVGLAVVGALASPVVAATLRVPANFATIQSAIAASASGDTVLVDPGTYNENIDFLGKAIVVQAPNGATIDGGGVAPCVSFRSGEGPASVIEGFRLVNGRGVAGLLGTYGGGVYVRSSSPTVRGNELRGCRATFGAGMAIRGGSPIVESNRFVQNSDPAISHGGGLFASGDGSPRLSDNEYESNYAAESGGGVYVERRMSVTLENEVFRHNEAEAAYGGGLAVISAHAVVTATSFDDNRATWGGAAAFDRSSAILESSTLTANFAVLGGGAVFARGEVETLTVVDCRFESNDAGIGAVYTQGGAIRAHDLSAFHGMGNRYYGNEANWGAAIEVRNVGTVRLERELLEQNDPSNGSGAVNVVNCSDVSIAQCRFERNFARAAGGAIHAEGGDSGGRFDVVGCTFAHNRAILGDGGAIVLSNVASDVRITNSLFHSNKAQAGAALYLDRSTATIDSCTIADGTAYEDGFALALPSGDSSNVVVTRSILWNRFALVGNMIVGSNVTLSDCIVHGGWPGERNEDIDPGFVAPPTDYRLRHGSPAIDRVEPTTADLTREDFEGEPRLTDGDLDGIALVDLGADELSPDVASRFGTVLDTTFTGVLESVLTVNHTAGNHRRVVHVGTHESLTIDVRAPRSGPNPARFVLYAYGSTPDMSTVRIQPFGLGLSTFATPMQRNESPPILRTWNNLGFPNLLGHPDRASSPAPSQLVWKPSGVGFETTVTIQGFIEDADSSAAAPVSLTNAVVIRVAD